MALTGLWAALCLQYTVWHVRREGGVTSTPIRKCSCLFNFALLQLPICYGQDNNHWHGLNIIFRIVWPTVTVFAAVVFMRVYPGLIVGDNLTVVESFAPVVSPYTIYPFNLTFKGMRFPSSPTT